MFFAREENSANRPLLVFVLLSLLVGGAGTFFTEPAIAGWYAALLKPQNLNPPNWLFAPVWTTLYVLMGVAASRVWKQTRFGVEIGFWTGQLTLNFLWSVIFFSRHEIKIALIEMVVLWLTILTTMVLFRRRDRIACLLMIPYLGWVTYALWLNGALWALNRCRLDLYVGVFNC